MGRSAKYLEEEAIRLAVIAHMQHAETDYDVLLVAGHERWEARAQVKGAVARVLEQWAALGRWQGAGSV